MKVGEKGGTFSSALLQPNLERLKVIGFGSLTQQRAKDPVSAF